MNHLDTFSGIGSWALAAKWMGWNTLAFVEKEPFCQQVLKKNFNGVPIHDDIFTFSALPFRGRVDVLTGSTPCQPFSQAGKREGSNDARHLFPELLRVVAECEPKWVIIENVYGLLNIEGGQVFEAYNTSLEGQGYSVQTLCIPASALNAPHRRDRLWIVAHSNSIGERTGYREVQETDGEISQRNNDAKSRNSESELRCPITYPDSHRALGERRDRYDSNIKRDGQTQIQERQNEQSGTEFADRENVANPKYVGRLREQGHDTKTYSEYGDVDRSNPNTECTGLEREGVRGAKSAEYDRDVTHSRCKYGQPGRDDGMATDTSERSYSESDVERCGDSSTDAQSAFGVTWNSKGSRQSSGTDRQGQVQYGRTGESTSEWHLNWRDVATATCVRGVDDGGSVDLDGFKLTASKHRENRLKALGNGIIPQIALEIFRAIDSSRKAQ